MVRDACGTRTTDEALVGMYTYWISPHLHPIEGIGLK